MSTQVVDLVQGEDVEDSCEHSSDLESGEAEEASPNPAKAIGPTSSEESDLVDDVSSSSDFNDVVDPAPERFTSVHIRKNLWIPFTGPSVRGKHDLICKELTESAFGMDLDGISITNPKKSSVLPITVEVINHQSLVEVRAVVAEEVSPLAERRKDVRLRRQHRVTGLTKVWRAPKHCHGRLRLSHG